MNLTRSKYNEIAKTILKYNISLIICDSREATENSMFVAISGNKYDGTKFIEEAIIKGAKIIVTDYNCNINVQYDNILYFQVENTREFLSFIAAKFYKHKPKYLVAVTGTSGKTSSVNFYQQIMQILGENSASIGSLGVINKGKEISCDKSHLTTPDSLYLNKQLNNLYNIDTKYVAIEASSHGIEQYRLDYLDFHACAFTNLSQDHLDYHMNMEAYFEAKTRLFKRLITNKYAILNSDIKQYESLKIINKNNNNEIIDYGKEARYIKIINIFRDDNKQKVEIDIASRIYKFDTFLLGEFQIYNILCALGLVISHKLSIIDAVKSISKLKSIDGRMQKVETKSNKKIYIDNSHKPEALLKVLNTIREILPRNGRSILVLGCGGDRDKIKRPIMGEIATSLSDYVIITDDNPRTEDAAEIRKDIIKGCDSSKIIEIENRKEAILHAINLLSDNDILLIAGRGSEDLQIFKDKTEYCNDYEIASNIIN